MKTLLAFLTLSLCISSSVWADSITWEPAPKGGLIMMGQSSNNAFVVPPVVECWFEARQEKGTLRLNFTTGEMTTTGEVNLDDAAREFLSLILKKSKQLDW